MRNADKIHIERAIVHAIDHIERDAPTTSDYEIPLGSRPKLREYFEGQVNNAVRTSAAFAARFRDPEYEAAQDCYRALDVAEDFVPASQCLAHALFRATRGNKSIAVGSLMVCLYTTPTYPGVTFLALIKIDLTEVLIQEVEVDSEGNRVVTFSVHDDALPTLGAKLLKAAIVCPRAKRPQDELGETYDLLLLDRQIKEEAAEFFAKGFLGTIPLLDDEKRTRKLWQGLNKARRKLSRVGRKGEASILKPDEAARFAAKQEQLLFDQHVDVPDLIAKTRFSEDNERDAQARVVVEETLDETVVDLSFQIDRSVAKGLMPKKRFVGDYGIEVAFAKRQAAQIYREVERKVEGQKTITIVELRVPDLDWIEE